jgi:hypothetical protein
VARKRGVRYTEDFAVMYINEIYNLGGFTTIDIFVNSDGSFDKKQICVACGGCSTLKKNVLRSGCIIRNAYYKEIFKEFQKKGK